MGSIPVPSWWSHQCRDRLQRTRRQRRARAPRVHPARATAAPKIKASGACTRRCSQHGLPPVPAGRRRARHQVRRQLDCTPRADWSVNSPRRWKLEAAKPLRCGIATSTMSAPGQRPRRPDRVAGLCPLRSDCDQVAAAQRSAASCQNL